MLLQSLFRHMLLPYTDIGVVMVFPTILYFSQARPLSQKMRYYCSCYPLTLLFIVIAIVGFVFYVFIGGAIVGFNVFSAVLDLVIGGSFVLADGF